MARTKKKVVTPTETPTAASDEQKDSVEALVIDEPGPWKFPKAADFAGVTKEIEPEAVIEGTVTLVPIHHFSIAINGTLATFHQGKAFVADVALQAALAAANAPVAKHE